MVNGESGQAITRRQITAATSQPLRFDATAMARTAGLSEDRAPHFALAVSEAAAAANTIVHAGGTGEVTLIRDGHQTVYARITDRGPESEPTRQARRRNPALPAAVDSG